MVSGATIVVPSDEGIGAVGPRARTHSCSQQCVISAYPPESHIPSDRDPLHDVPRDGLLAAVVELRGSRVRMPQQVLDIRELDALLEEVGRGGGAKRVALEHVGGEACRG